MCSSELEGWNAGPFPLFEHGEIGSVEREDGQSFPVQALSEFDKFLKCLVMAVSWDCAALWIGAGSGFRCVVGKVIHGSPPDLDGYPSRTNIATIGADRTRAQNRRKKLSEIRAFYSTGAWLHPSVQL